MPFSLIAAAIGIIAGFLARARMFSNIAKTIVSALLIAVVAVIASVLIRVIFFGGFATSGTTVLIASLMAAGIDFWPAQFIGQVVSELPDKGISAFIPYWLIRNMSLRYIVKFPNGRLLVEDLKKKQGKKEGE